MTTRSFDATDLVVLPRFTAAGAIALGASIESAAKEASKESPLPPPCASAAARVRETHEGLRKEFAKRVRSTSLSADELGRLDAGLDSAWAALSSIVAAHTRAPFGPVDQPLADAALRVQRALFADGLKFTQLPYKLEWAESQARLDLVEDPSLAMDLSALQADRFVALIRAQHAAYGDAQGLSKEAQPEPSADIRTHLDRFSAAVRSYVVKVSATAEEGDDASRALVDRLLAPIASWQSSATNTPTEPEPIVPPLPAPPVPT